VKSYADTARRCGSWAASTPTRTCTSQPFWTSAGNVLGTPRFYSTRAGYGALTRSMRTRGDVTEVGIVSTGSYGAGITRRLADVDVLVIEVNRLDRADRPRRGCR